MQKIIVSKTDEYNGELIVKLPFSEERLHKIRKIYGRKWHPEMRFWTIPDKKQILDDFKRFFADEYVDYSRIDQSYNPFQRLNYKNKSLIEQLIKKIKLKGYSNETCKSYKSNIIHFLLFSQGSILIRELIDLYILYLVNDKKYKPNTINHIINSIVFFCRNILKRYEISDSIERLKKDKLLPIVLNNIEVKNLLREFKT